MNATAHKKPPAPPDIRGALLRRKELQGAVKTITYRSEDSGWTVARVVDEEDEELRTVVGVLDLEQGVPYRFKGKFVQHETFGLQFKAEIFDIVVPSGARGLQNYLASGLFDNVGPRRARDIVARFGEDAPRIIEEDPGRLAEIHGITSARALLIQERWTEAKEGRSILIQLHRYGLTSYRVRRIYGHYGERSIEVLEQNPYRLIRDLERFGWATVDGIARRLGIPLDDPARARAAIVHLIEEAAGEGSTVVTSDRLLKEAIKIKVPEDRAAVAIDVLVERGEVVEVAGGYAAKRYYGAESFIASWVKRRI